MVLGQAPASIHPYSLADRAGGTEEPHELNALALGDPHSLQGAMPLLKWLAK